MQDRQCFGLQLFLFHVFHPSFQRSGKYPFTYPPTYYILVDPLLPFFLMGRKAREERKRDFFNLSLHDRCVDAEQSVAIDVHKVHLHPCLSFSEQDQKRPVLNHIYANYSYFLTSYFVPRPTCLLLAHASSSFFFSIFLFRE